MIFTLLDLVLNTTMYGVKQIYNGGYYLVYGPTLTTEEKLYKELKEIKNGKYCEDLEERIKFMLIEMNSQNKDRDELLSKELESQKLLIEELRIQNNLLRQQIVIRQPSTEDGFVNFYKMMAQRL